VVAERSASVTIQHAFFAGEICKVMFPIVGFKPIVQKVIAARHGRQMLLEQFLKFIIRRVDDSFVQATVSGVREPRSPSS
jgi:hypothetical protein